MSGVVRRLAPDEWATWREIRLRSLAESPDAFGSTLEREESFTAADWQLRLASPSVVVEDGGRSVACAAAFEPEHGQAMIVAMWVEPTHRGHGHCRQMLDHLVAWAHDRGSEVVLGVNRANPGARAAYQAYGFVPTGEQHPLRDGSEQVCDVLVLPPRRPGVTG